jgi:hypothetical protein
MSGFSKTLSGLLTFGYDNPKNSQLSDAEKYILDVQ